MARNRRTSNAYAEAYAALDAGRRVLQCRACEAREVWTGVVAAVIKGWGYEDTTVEGKRVRFWACPECKKPDPFTPAYPAQGEPAKGSSSSGDETRQPFGGRRAVVIRLGASGTQIGVVVGEDKEIAQVVAWSAGPCRWRKPKKVSKDKILGTAAPAERRTKAALAAWPPEFLKAIKRKVRKK